MKFIAAITCVREQGLSPLRERRLFHLGLKLTLAVFVGLILSASVSGMAAQTAEQSNAEFRSDGPVPAEPTGGIKEEIPERYRKRYDHWKTEFLSTETGRNQWQKYEHNTRFLLSITVSRVQPNNATTGQYKWNDSGTLTSATITLGCRIDKGYPDLGPYYPVTSSLALFESVYVKNSREILAAAKIAHEFGHVDRMANVERDRFKLEIQLMRDYLSILKESGPGDLRLIELEGLMGGTPQDLWKDGEYWAEANAMLYIGEKIKTRRVPSLLLNKIKQAVDSRVKGYPQRRRILAAAEEILAVK